MAGNEILGYAQVLSSYLPDPTGDAQLAGLLAKLEAAATEIQGYLDAAESTATATEAVWTQATTDWNTAVAAFKDYLANALLGVLADIPGLAELVQDVTSLATEGVHGSLDLGPVHLEVASSSLVVQLERFSDSTNTPAPLTVGPYRVGEIAATMASPFGGANLPGGGSIVRMPTGGGYGGTLQLPLGVVEISAAAVISMIDGEPSFLAILGAQFVPPIQLSFGFSLDRVGGIVGINRREDTDALRAAVRTGTAGDVLFAIRPPASPLALVTAADALFPAQSGTSLVGPSLKISWLSFGPQGSLVSLDLAVIVEIPTGRVTILGVARASIPDLPGILNIRVDLLGIIDPVAQIVSIDASLVDSHVLGIFQIYGDGAMRFSWGSQAYAIVTIGGFYPGFKPEPAQIPALRRVGLSLDNPIDIISIRVEGYFAVTSNTIQFGGSLQVGIFEGIEAHGFVTLDAIVQFRPFAFRADISAGFAVSVDGFSFASVTLSGHISGPGPLVIEGSLSISVFLFSISWDETFTLGSGPADSLPTPDLLLTLIAAELAKPEAVTTVGIGDAQVVLVPRPTAGATAALPPTGTLQVAQRRAPLTIPVERADGRPLAGAQTVSITTSGLDVTERFSPGSFIDLDSSSAMSQPAYEDLPAGRVLSLTDPAESTFPFFEDWRTVELITLPFDTVRSTLQWQMMPLADMVALGLAASRPAALSEPGSKLITATTESWVETTSGTSFPTATAAHLFVRHNSGVALAEADAGDPVDLAAVL